MRICAFLKKENESKAYAKSYLNVLNVKKYCEDKNVSFEEACKDPRISNRIDIAALGTAYVYMGKIEDAKNMLLLMMMNPVCWFCDKCGCLEYYLLKAEIDIAEGNNEEALKFLDEVEKTEWNNHEEIAASLKLYLTKYKD
jgi:tetratricopeptide (TPR) repeat protein